jgi:prepilin-type N-terminal cleavage/methylation domain-containing protein
MMKESFLNLIRKESLMRKGFTIAEVVVVVFIIALLVSIAVPNMLTSRRGANEAAARSTLKSFSAACESYATINLKFPGLITYLTSPDPPYFSFDLSAYDQNNPRDGYWHSLNLADGGYTVVAEPSNANTGNWDYRITTGSILQRRPSTGGTWVTF